jgi:hypothetical protein
MSRPKREMPSPPELGILRTVRTGAGTDLEAIVAGAATGELHVGMTRFRVGDLVRAERDAVARPPRGSWPKYRGRVGTVVSLNVRDDEIGVSWTPSILDPKRQSADSWFASYELTIVEHPRLARTRGLAATQRPRTDGSGGTSTSELEVQR